MDMWNISFKQYKYTEKKTNDIPLTHYVFISILVNKSTQIFNEMHVHCLQYAQLSMSFLSQFVDQ